MKITIGHLFYDILNLYGESGNVLALKHALEMQDIEVEIKNLSLNDSIDFNLLDFIYIGSGTKQNEQLAIEYLKNYKEDILQYVMNKKFFFVTGNSIEMFGKYIKELDNSKFNCLEIFDYYTEATKTRLVCECIFKHEELACKILGFENHQGITKDNPSPLFTVVKGYGNQVVEGFVKDNFYATYLIGPILARNPEFLEYITKKLITSLDKEFKFKSFDFEFLVKAHDKFLEKYN